MGRYPFLNFGEIKERCKTDITNFRAGMLNLTSSDLVLKSYLQKIDPVLYPLQNPNNVESCKRCIESIKTNINTERSTSNQSFEGHDITSFDYPHDIIGFSPLQQVKLWLLRTQLFYQLVIISINIMLEPMLFNAVYGTPARYGRKRAVEFYTAQLMQYKLGIFGSLTPTSDIDVGIQYAGSGIDNGLAYIVSIIEDAFLIFTGIDSLHFDIELYADMMTITDAKGEDVFYMDTTKFQQTHFQKMLPYVEASILRNYVTAMHDIASHEDHNHGHEVVHETTDKVDTYLNKFKYSDLFQMLNTRQVIPIGYKNAQELMLTAKMDPSTVVNQESKAMVREYMTASYDQAREKYYVYVNDAEALVGPQRRTVKISGVIKLSPDEVLKIMMKVAKALVYRAESYTCPPTVMHVVRILQANPDNLKDKKYTVDFPSYCETSVKPKKAFCNIGNYGYLISIFEQFGYIYRFHLTYCLPEKKEKCEKKMSKYVPRVTNAVEILETQPLDAAAGGMAIQGGKRRKSRRLKKRKNKRTQRR